MDRPYIFLLCAAISLSRTAYAQDWQWAMRGQGSQSAVASSVAVDADGNSVIVGSYSGLLTIGAQTLSTPGMDGIFMAKFDNSGALLWAHIAANSALIAPHGVSVDEAGRIAITGIYKDTVVFIPGFLGTTLISAGAFDVFTALYTPDGDPLWARSLGDTGFDYGAAVDQDAQGNVYINGEFHQYPFNGSASKVFIAKYDLQGNHLWTTQSANYGSYHLGDGITTDAAGTSCIIGEFFTEITIGPFVLNPGNGEMTIYVAKIDADGEPVWAQQAGAGGYAGAEGVGMDAEGNAYITGFYHGTSTFGTLTLPGPGEMAYDPFVAKCASADGTFLWAHGASGPGTSDLGWGIGVDTLGNSYVIGSFGGTLTVGSTTLQTAGGVDLFVAKYSPAGDALWATSCGGAASESIGDIAVHGPDVFVVGGYTSSIFFNSNVTLPGQPGVQDAFVAKLTDMDNGINEVQGPTCLVYPDPVMDQLHVNGLRGMASYAIVDMQGRTFRTGPLAPQQCIPVADLPNGAYVLRLNTGARRGKFEELEFIKR